MIGSDLKEHEFEGLICRVINEKRRLVKGDTRITVVRLDDKDWKCSVELYRIMLYMNEGNIHYYLKFVNPDNKYITLVEIRDDALGKRYNNDDVRNFIGLVVSIISYR